MKKKYFRGTFIKLTYKYEFEETNEFILAECHESGYLFQIICVSGYHAGTIAGYIKEGSLAEKSIAALTHKELIEGLKANFLNLKVRSIVIQSD